MNYAKLQRYIDQNEIFISIHHKFSDASNILGLSLVIKEIAYTYYDTLPYMKALSQKQEYFDLFEELLGDMNKFKNQVLYQKSDYLDQAFYDYLHMIMDTNLCGPKVLGLKGFELELCQRILDGALTQGLVVAISRQSEDELQEFHLTKFDLSLRNPEFPPIDLQYA